MAAKKENKATSAEDKLLVKAFKDGSHNWWCNMKHFTILNNILVCAAGGDPTDEEVVHIAKYLKTKKLI